MNTILPLFFSKSYKEPFSLQTSTTILLKRCVSIFDEGMESSPEEIPRKERPGNTSTELHPLKFEFEGLSSSGSSASSYDGPVIGLEPSRVGFGFSQCLPKLSAQKKSVSSNDPILPKWLGCQQETAIFISANASTDSESDFKYEFPPPNANMFCAGTRNSWIVNHTPLYGYETSHRDLTIEALLALPGTSRARSPDLLIDSVRLWKLFCHQSILC